ncbi:hypothetical protein [Bacillus sp. XF8]|nr:hypothetical protein [Bacillus sp. XF8]MBO1579061.1 hypothetical protein [Bacillus sp. XF8]
MEFVVINENTEEGFQDLTFNITHYWREGIMLLKFLVNLKEKLLDS